MPKYGEKVRGFRLSDWHIQILDLYCHQTGMNRTEAIRRLIEEKNEREHLDLIEPEIFRRRRLKAESVSI